MPHKIHKVRKMRGSRTHGYGVIGQHRKKGTKGHRKAGRHKGGWTYTIKYEPDYFGKKGFTPRGKKQKKNTINVSEVDNLVLALSKQKKIKKKNGKHILDLIEMGYDKLLGKGKITQPVLVKITSYSNIANKKIEEIGGQILKEEN